MKTLMTKVAQIFFYFIWDSQFPSGIATFCKFKNIAPICVLWMIEIRGQKSIFLYNQIWLSSP